MDPLSIWCCWFYYGSAFVAVILLTMWIFQLAVSNAYPKIVRSINEKHFLDPANGKMIAFPSLDEKASVHLSVIVPAYNEEKRLGVMLDECTSWLQTKMQQTTGFSYEIIVVSDGSRDNTVQIAQNYSKELGVERFRVLALEENRGKGGAVRLGMLSARGAQLLFADADGATKFSDLNKLETEMSTLINVDSCYAENIGEERLAIVIASRSHLEKASLASRSVFRTVLMWGFHLMVWLFAVRAVRDTQCGFKLFTRAAARLCFYNLHVERWAFDVEALYIAQKLKVPISEVAVNWTEIDGSKITPIWSWLQMGGDLILIWLRYKMGVWQIKSTSN